MNGKDEKNDKSPNKEPNIPNPSFNLTRLIMIALVVTFLGNALRTNYSQRAMSEVTYDEFLAMLDKGEVKSVVIEDDLLTIYCSASDEKLDDNAIVSEDEDEKLLVHYTGNLKDESLIEKLDEKGVKYSRPVVFDDPFMNFILSWVIPIAFISFVFSLFNRSLAKRMSGGGAMGNVGKSTAKIYIEKDTGVTFKDVAGQEEAKDSLSEIIDFLHNPDKYTAIGAKQPKGALLVGPPGTGKTLLAKAVAGEAKVPFFSLSGSDFVEMFVGVGASRVRDLFKQAESHAPSIIFIDELDAIGKSRDTTGISRNDEQEQTLNQLLAEMDGFDSSKGIVILAATNRPEVLDKALLRPGRFDRRIIVENPDLIGREAILKVHSKDVKMSTDVDLKKIALATAGSSGADLANIINEAALRAVRMGRNKVLHEDLMEAVEVIIAGQEKKDRIMSEKDKKLVAYHEVGHALVSALQKNTMPLQKITIVPRTMGALGYVLTMPEEERYILTNVEMLEEIAVMLGGRAAEEIIFNVKTTGASNDIERATDTARKMVAMYGMSEKYGVMGLESVQSKYLDGRAVSNAAEITKAGIDEEVYEILDESLAKAKQILNDNVNILNEIAETLIEKETILGEEFMDIIKKHKDIDVEENDFLEI